MTTPVQVTVTPPRQIVVTVDPTVDEVRYISVAAAPGIPGPPGPPGTPGPAGGKRWFGDGPPELVIGAAPGDEYVDKLTGTLYVLE